MRNGYITQENVTDEIGANVPKNKNNKKHIIQFFIWLVILLFVYYQVYELVMYTLGKKDKSVMWLYNGINKVVTTIIPHVAKETTEQYSVKLAALGDIYTSTNIMKGVKSGSTYNFEDPFTQAKDILSKYDVVLASLNTPVAGSSLGYSTKTVYNAPDDLLTAIKSLNISILASAGNHINDKGETGINATIKNIESTGLTQVGLGVNSERAKPYVIDKNNIKIGVLSYMTTSKVKVAKGKDYLINILTEDNVKADMAYLKNQKVDFVICYLNVPNEDATLVDAEQKNDTDLLLDNGVNVVLGTGSKVVQEKMEDMYQLPDQTNNHAYVIYSLGDFLGDMDTDARKESVGADITFTKSVTKDKDGKVIDDKTKSNMTANKPLTFYTKVTSAYKITNYSIDTTIDLYNQDKIDLETKDYTAIKSAQDDLTEILK